MKKFFLIALAFALALAARAVTVVGDIRLVNQDASNNVFTASGLDLPMNFNGRQYANVPVQGQLTNGQLCVKLETPGRWNISFYGLDTSLRINAPANTNTYDISQMLTNSLVFVNQGISRYVQPGSGIVITTNNPGLATEYLTIASSGGVAANVYQMQINSAGLVFSTNALQFIYTLGLNANLQGWSAIAPSGKQDHAADLDLWAAIAPSTKQDHSANLDSWSGLATSAKQDHAANLDTWATRTIDGTTIIDTGGVLSAATGGSGNVTGTGPSTSGHLPKFNNGTANGIDDALLIASTVLTNNANYAVTFNGGVAAPGAMPANTNGLMSATNMQRLIDNQFIDIGPLAPATGVNLFGVDAGTNAVPIHARNNLTLTSDGAGGFYLDGAAGGGASPMVCSNILVQQTNEIIWDIKAVQHLTLMLNTNLNRLTISNAWAITNAPSGIVQLDTWEDTNGTWRVLSTNVIGGLLRTYGGWNRGTNASQYDTATLKLDGTPTNVLARWDTNAQPPLSFTNTLTAGGGGGGGGGGTFTIVGSPVSTAGTTGDTTSPDLDTTTATDLFALVTGGGGTHPTLTDNKGNTWTADIDWGNSHYSLFHAPATSVGAGHHVTVSLVSGFSVLFFAVKRSSGNATFVAASTPGSTGSWSGGTVRAGSLTPAGANDLFIAIAWWDVGAGGAGDTVDSSYVKMDAVGTNPGLGGAYKIKSSDSTAENPGWSHAGAADGFFIQADYQ